MTSHRRWRIAILLGCGVLVNYFDRVNVSVAHDALHDDFGLSNFAFGIVAGAYSWTYAALQLPMGVLLDRFGVRVIGRISALLWSVASFAAAAAMGVRTFVASRLLLGIGEASTFPANAKAIGYWFPRQERSLATAVFDAAAKFASALGVPMLGVTLIKFGWRLSFVLTGVLSFLYFAAFAVIYRDPQDDSGLSEMERQYIAERGAQPRADARIRPGAPLSDLVRQRKVLGLTIGFGAYNYCFYLFLTWLPAYFSAALHVNLLHSVLYTSAPWLFATFTDLLVGGWLVDTLVRRGCRETIVRQSILIGGTALGLAIAGAMFAHTAGAAVVWISISLGGLSAAAPVGWSIPSLIAPPNSVGRIGGILNFGNQVAAIVAPIATGYFAGPENSFGRAFGAAAAILIVGIASYVFLLGKIEPIAEPAQV
ncbi:MAG: MFS transporter [Acidobacteriaceae bacterium]|nr:MFS transporter [Acidobacteriaceae bacterium]